MADGQIIIETRLQDNGVKKGLQDISKSAKQLDNVTKSIDNTNQKLQLQQQKLSGLKEAYKNAADPSQQIKLQEQIVNTESKITSLEGKLNNLKDKKINLTAKVDTESIDSMVSDINKAGSSISNIGNSLTTKVTLPVVAAFGVAAKEAGEFEHQMADVAKEVKAKGENVDEVMGQMSANSLKWSEDFGQSTDDINKGFLILVKDGYSGAESMQIMNTALETARGANEDLFTVIDQLGGSLEAYGQKTDNAAQTTANMSHMADTFAYISNHTKASISSLGEAFSTCGQTAAALGQPMEQTASAIGILQSSNIDASTAATSLKAGLVNLTKPTKNMQKAMKELGLEAFDSNGKMKDMATIIDDVNKGSKNMTDQQKQAAIAMLFGKESLASWNVLVSKGGDYLRNLSSSAGNATGEVKELSDSMKDTPVNKMKEAEASFKALGITLGEEVLPELMPLVQELTNVLKSFSELDESTKQEIISWALMAAAMGPIAKIVGTITTDIGGLVSFGGRLAASLGLIGEGATLGGEALVGFSTAGLAAAGVATALVAGVAGVVTYNNLLSKSVDTSTDDLSTWEKVVNTCTGSTIKSKEELQKAGLVYKDFGDGVSKEFKSGIEEATKQYHDFEMALTGANSDDKMSSENQTKIIGTINKMIDGAKSAITSRKGEIKNQLTDLFTADGSGIDESEQKVLDEAASGFDEKLNKVSEIQNNITEIWQKAIADHGKLSDEDVKQIESYMQQIKQIQAEVNAKNDTESSFAKNEYSERLNGISAEDATKEFQDASKTVKDNFSKLRATYQTGIDDLNKMEKQAEEKGNTEQIADIKKQIEEKTKAYKDSLGQEQSQIRDYLNTLYEKNPQLEGKLNEITGEMFSTKDLNAQGDLYKLKQQYSEVAEATESGMKRVQDSTGKWHDIYVTVDEATGNITSAFDTFNGQYGGYSKTFEDQAKTTGEKVQKSMQELATTFQYNLDSIKNNKVQLNGDNLVNIDTGATISKFQTIIEKANGLKVAIANINGEQVKIEFNKDGTIANADDVRSAVVDHLASSPAKVDINVNDKDALEKFKETEDEADKVTGKNPNINITVDNGQAIEATQEVKDILDKLKNKNIDVHVNLSGDGVAELQDEKMYTRQINKAIQGNYTGSNSPQEGLSYVDEHGYETADKDNVKMIKPGLAYISSHASGGDGINSHMTTVNEMHNDITSQVNGSIGQIVSKLTSALSSQSGKLSTIADNTAQTVKVGQEGNNLNQDLAKNIVDQYRGSTTGSFSSLNTEIEMANKSKENASNMKVEDNSDYVAAKAKLDEITDQIEELKDKSQDIGDNMPESVKYTTTKTSKTGKVSTVQKTDDSDKKAAEEEKKQIEADEHELERKKELAQKEADLAKEVAQNEIEQAKKSAEEQVKIAEEKKEKLTKIADAVTTAIKNKLTEEKKDYDTAAQDELTSMEDSYNKQVSALEKSLKKKTDDIDQQIKDLENQSTDTSRDDTRTEYNNKISVLQNKMNNTASYEDKQSYALQIKDAQAELSKQENQWSIDDQKTALETEKSNLEKQEQTKKDSLEKQYNASKEAKEKEIKNTDAYYDKLLEEDSINAQARYMLLQGNNEDLVKLLQSYNPQWQDAGQSLADSLLTGLNSQKQNIEQAVNEIVMLRKGTSYDSDSLSAPTDYLDVSTNKRVGYATGTNYNQTAGLYNTNEQGFEMSTSGDVAYVSQGASIKNHMETQNYIDSLMGAKISTLQASLIQSQQDTIKSLFSSTFGSNSSTTNNNKNILHFNVEHFHNERSQDIEDLSNELAYHAFKQRTY